MEAFVGMVTNLYRTEKRVLEKLINPENFIRSKYKVGALWKHDWL